MITDVEAAAAVEANAPEVKPGQTWKPVDFPTARRIRVVCRYPFAGPDDGRTWVVEEVHTYERLRRMPELTLRSLFELHEDVS